MILTEVQVVAPVGTKFGLVKSPAGVLTIVCRPPATPDWPHGIVPDSGRNEIAPGFTRYIVCDEPTEKTISVPRVPGPPFDTTVTPLKEKPCSPPAS